MYIVVVEDERLAKRVLRAARRNRARIVAVVIVVDTEKPQWLGGIRKNHPRIRVVQGILTIPP